MQEIDIESYPNVKAWLARIAARQAVQRGLNIPPRFDGF
jgi:glutathione S-transferase